jgi:Fe-S cluster assembly protein SufD
LRFYASEGRNVQLHDDARAYSGLAIEEPSAAQGLRRNGINGDTREGAMNVAVIRTKAEAAFAENFAKVASRLPGGKAVAERRQAEIRRFAELGLPHRRVEAWKYTDLRAALKEALPVAGDGVGDVDRERVERAIASLSTLDAYRVVFINGRHRPELTRLEGIDGFAVKPLAEALANAPDRVGEGLAATNGPASEAVLALNTAFMSDGAVLRVEDGAALVKPVLLIYVHAGEVGSFVATRNVVNVGTGASVVLIEAHVSLAGAAGGQANSATEVTIGEGARVTHVKHTMQGAHATHIASWVVGLGAKSCYRAFQFTAGTGLARNQLFVTFNGEGAKLDISGMFMARGSEHVDTTLVVDHAAGGGESRELFKGVLDDRARGVFQGRVIVRPGAQKSDGKQMARALMLSEEAEFASKPELEIHADDVICGHGSTCAELDEDLLFYMRSRGIPQAVARAMLIECFVAEAIDKIEQEDVRAAIMDIARTWLIARTAA